MPIAPIHRLKMMEIRWLASHRCKHGSTYLEHYNCFLKEQPNQERIGFLDIEASNLKANFGIMFCYCIKVFGKDKIYHRTITKKELKKNLDKEVVRQCIKDMMNFDTLVGYYSTKYDFPFIRTRAVMHKLDFPTYGTLKHKDVYYMVRNKFCLNRNSQETACRSLLGSTEKNHIDANYWIRALQGNRKALAYILDHCKRDVRDLERLYKTVINFRKKADTFM